jgi:hypothetical protein
MSGPTVNHPAFGATSVDTLAQGSGKDDGNGIAESKRNSDGCECAMQFVGMKRVDLLKEWDIYLEEFVRSSIIPL